MIRRALVLACALAAGCVGTPALTPPPPPLRPEPQPKPEVATNKDCDPTDPAAEKKSLSFDERSIPEGQRLSDQAYTKLKAADSHEVDRATREQMLGDSVNDFLTALAADPYNVNATYGLAAAYAIIGRKQCSINLLARLLQMRPHQSQHAEVEAKLDHLLGRNRQVLDPDFNDMRRDDRFRQLIQKMCEGTSDPTKCVYGGTTTGP